MALVNKQDPKKIFASQAPSQDVPAGFNNYERGWDESRKNNGKPTIKQFNKLQQLADEKILWIHQNGAAMPFDETMEYADGAVVVKNGDLHQLKDGNWQTLKQKGIGELYQEDETYEVGDEVRLENGNRVRSTINSNTNNPNSNMTGWVLVNSASQIFDGLDSQHDLNDGFKATRILFATPEMFGGKANDPDFDNTAALNAAFLTGKDVYSTPDKTYYVQNKLIAKGQRLVGGWKINTVRYGIGTVDTFQDQTDDISIRMLYLESAWDLSELLKIRMLGFNVINHYGYFANNGSEDAAGTIEILLDNAKTAGLKVNLGTQSPRALANMAEFIGATTNHSATWGYSVFDEPASLGVTVAQQDEKIALLRTLTDKQLSFVDLCQAAQPFNQLFSKNYDLAFVDSYSKVGFTLEQDLDKMRMDFGTIKAMTGLKRVYPVVAAFTDKGGYYASDVNQVITASKIFGTVAGGNFGAFVWDGVGDGNITQRVRSNSQLQDLVKFLTSQKTRKELVTETFIFGTAGNQTDWGIGQLLDVIPVIDKNTTDTNVWGGAYPVIVKNGTPENDRQGSDITQKYSGIGFKANFSTLQTNIKYRKRVRFIGEIFAASPSIVLNGTFSLTRSLDNGYTNSIQYADNYSGNTVKNFGTTAPNPDERIGIRLENTGDSNPTYRKLIRGIIISTDW